MEIISQTGRIRYTLETHWETLTDSAKLMHEQFRVLDFLTYKRNIWNKLTINHCSIILFTIALVSLITIYSKFLALSCLQTSQFLEDKILILRPIFFFLIPASLIGNLSKFRVSLPTTSACVGGGFYPSRFVSRFFKICLKICPSSECHCLSTTSACVGGGFYHSRWWLNLEIIFTFVSGLQKERIWHLCSHLVNRKAIANIAIGIKWTEGTKP